jgi:hypothetical protein
MRWTCLGSCAHGSLCEGSARRVRRCPLWAHGVAVSASLRLRCDARLGLGRLTRSAHFVRYPQTRSGKSVHEVRFAHRAQDSPCRPRRARRPGCSPGTNSPLDCLCPGSPPRRPTVSPQWAPPAAQAPGAQCIGAMCSRGHKAAAGQAPARICGAEKRRIRGRARSAPRELTCRFLFERSERSERSELSDGHESEHRRAAGAKRRPPHLRAGACPAGALPRKTDARESACQSLVDTALRPRTTFSIRN